MTFDYFLTQIDGVEVTVYNSPMGVPRDMYHCYEIPKAGFASRKWIELGAPTIKALERANAHVESVLGWGLGSVHVHPMHYEAFKLECANHRQPLKSAPKCECGVAKVGGIHSDWCGVIS